ncbi:hypothetical protein, partial [Ectothiorhodospira sp. 9905]
MAVLYTHIGWIPCVTGHLNFSLIRPGIVGGFTNKRVNRKDSSLVCYSVAEGGGSLKLKAMMQSEVDWKDSLHLNIDASGHYRVFLLAQTTDLNNLDGSCLSGKIFIYPNDLVVKSFEDSGHVFEAIHHAKKRIDEALTLRCERQCKGQYLSPKSLLSRFLNKCFSPYLSCACSSPLILSLDSGDIQLREELDQHYADITKGLTEALQDNGRLGLYGVSFFVKHNGLAYFTFDGCCRPSDEERSTILRQAYYYLKYSIHSHAHHDCDADSLTQLVKLGGDGEEDLERASLEMVGQLKRELTFVKRNTYENFSYEPVDACGVLAYMGSLCVTLRDEGMITRSTYEREGQYLHQVEESFRAQLKRHELKKAEKESVTSTYRTKLTWFLSAVSLLAILFASIYLRDAGGDVVLQNPVSAPYFILCFSIFAVVVFSVHGALLRRSLQRLQNERKTKEWVEREYKQPFAQRVKRKVAPTLIKVLVIMVIFGLAVVLYFVSGASGP